MKPSETMAHLVLAQPAPGQLPRRAPFDSSVGSRCLFADDFVVVDVGSSCSIPPSARRPRRAASPRASVAPASAPPTTRGQHLARLDREVAGGEVARGVAGLLLERRLLVAQMSWALGHAGGTGSPTAG